MKLIAIDGNSLMHRAYYALPNMTNKAGTPTGALHGFLSMLLKLVDMRPDYLLVAFDMPIKTFRHEKYADYKAGRRETPDDLRTQFPLLQELLKKMGIAVIECERFEADDILGTFSRRAQKEGVDSLLVTGDRDALQLITDNVHVLMTKKGITETVEYDKGTLFAEYGLEPARMVDLKGLMGDNSDNLPGIKGVGEKTALKLLSKYGTMESVLENAENEKGALRQKLLDGAESARMSYELGTINTDAPVSESVEDCRFNPALLANGAAELTKLELRAVLKRVRELAGTQNQNAANMPEPNGKDAAEVRTAEFDLRDVKSDEELQACVDTLLQCTETAFDICEQSVTVAAITPRSEEICSVRHCCPNRFSAHLSPSLSRKKSKKPYLMPNQNGISLRRSVLRSTVKFSMPCLRITCLTHYIPQKHLMCLPRRAVSVSAERLRLSF